MSGLLHEGTLLPLAAAALLAGTGLALFGGERTAGAARWAVGSGGYLLLLALLARGLQAHAWPLGSAYEAALLAAAATALAVGIAPRHAAARGAGCAGGGALLLLGLALLLTPPAARAAQAPPGALAGVLFPLHVVVTALGYGGLVPAGAAGLVRLLRGKDEAGEALIQRGLAWGYPLLTLGMALGALWSWQTWGRCWNWGVKEALTLVTWGLFTLALHTRRLKGWSGRVHAAVLVLGLAAVLVTLLGATALARWAGMGEMYVF